MASNHVGSGYGEDMTQTGDLSSNISIVSQIEKKHTL